MKNIVKCPWCHKGKTLSDTTAELKATCQCGVCGKYYEVDFATMRAQRARALPQKTSKADN